MSTPQPPSPAERYWQRNLAVCALGAFTTIVAMTLLLPFLPLYVEQLGVSDPAAIVQWSGVAFGATFLSAAITAPLWGRLGDRYGRKLMLIRASLGMALAMSLIGLAENVWQLVLLRLLAGLLGGYASGATILVATQTPKARSGWALGVLSSGIMAGSLAGPLIGGLLPPLIGIRNTFFIAGAVIFVTFLATTFLLKEAPREPRTATQKGQAPEHSWASVTDKKPLLSMFAVACLLMFATMSIEPIITVYLQELRAENVTLMAGLVMSAAALGSIISASQLGKLADRIGHWRVLTVCLAAAALLLIPQALVSAPWQLVLLRFLMGLALGGLLPCISSIIRHSVPENIAGRMLGYSTSSQYVGQVLGPLAGGFLGGHFGMRTVFVGTCGVMALCALVTWWFGSMKPAVAVAGEAG
ncbi:MULTISPECIES: MFS transporter [Pseudomonas]|uniref:MFS-type transporter n=2 Tax=Pseudomonas chlororaphis TaxID=587753 RepID=A0AAD0ZHF1_9PSED|nr:MULTISPECIES: MFS transporter [Pseudomonas]AZD21644.1 putative MFS-type transporter [Pseudomonas chlororaphis subsp. aurantiaca]AZD91815.1 putative MFS-type transporter [Pseudomonas chlororaphis subsp. aureofaciens]AZD98295.1 putative MFS-type transporter [Pseudomonas chlororaphis subsp. aureofaciens]AZE04525.1 putative MFS-type transporter [Pseudomonas chlororaphis subsp. aureofaciens]AZE29139.1 putative MFS-type transporter [Pseudomonas chlororaphis subsp. aureofaciens]